MSQSHLAPADLRWYLRLGLEQLERGWSSPRADQVEQHVATCSQCAASLSVEAQLELSLHEVARRGPLPTRSTLIAWLGTALAALALLVALGSLSATTDSITDHSVAAPLDAGIQRAYDGDITE